MELALDPIRRYEARGNHKTGEWHIPITTHARYSEIGRVYALTHPFPGSHEAWAPNYSTYATLKYLIMQRTVFWLEGISHALP